MANPSIGFADLGGTDMKRTKLIVILVSFCMILSVFAGCAEKVDMIEEAQGPIEITIWHDKEAEVAAVLQDALDALAPDVIVNLIRKDGLTEALKLVGNDPSAAPDMYWFAHDKVGLYAELGILAPITDFVSVEELANYVDVTISAVTYDDTIFQLPLYYETLLFMYNKEYMTEDEVPNTSEELYLYMQENTDGERFGFVEQYCTPYYSIPWIHGFDGYLLNEEGVPGLDNENTIAALKYKQKFLEYLPQDSASATVNTLFLEGFADSIIGGPWLVPTAREANIDLGFAVMPVVDETGKSLAPYIGVQGVHVLKIVGETKAEAVTQILKLLINPQIGISLAKASGCAPANTLCYEDESVSADEMVMTMRETSKTALPIPNIPEMDIIFTIAGNLLVDVNLKGTDPIEAAAEYQNKALRMIEAMK